MNTSIVQDIKSNSIGARVFRNRIAELLGTYSTCQASQLGNRRVDFEKAYEHVMSCGWCIQHLYSLEEVRNMRNQLD